MTVYRIVRGKYREDLSGTGAELFGGRWNSKGTKMLYTASSIALAMTEVAVHIPFGILPKGFFVISITLPKVKIQKVSLDSLEGTSWDSHPPSHITQQIGDAFIKNAKHLVLEVPSVVVPGDVNYLINPLHKNSDQLKITATHPFRFDHRLFTTER